MENKKTEKKYYEGDSEMKRFGFVFPTDHYNFLVEEEKTTLVPPPNRIRKLIEEYVESKKTA
jgi:hypothetical protein